MDKNVKESNFYFERVEITLITIICVLTMGCLNIDNLFFNVITSSKEVHLIKDFSYIFIATGGIILFSLLLISIRVNLGKLKADFKRNMLLSIIFSIIILAVGIISQFLLNL